MANCCLVSVNFWLMESFVFFNFGVIEMALHSHATSNYYSKTVFAETVREYHAKGSRILILICIEKNL